MISLFGGLLNVRWGLSHYENFDADTNSEKSFIWILILTVLLLYGISKIWHWWNTRNDLHFSFWDASAVSPESEVELGQLDRKRSPSKPAETPPYMKVT